MTFKELEAKVKKEGFGMYPYIGEVAMSKGIRIYLEEGREAQDTVYKALRRFDNGDFGTFYDMFEKPSEFPYGQYPSIYGDDLDAGAIMIHRERNGTAVIYFQFER